MLFWIIIDVIVCVDLFCIKIVFKIELLLLEVLWIFNVFEGVNDNGGLVVLILVRICGWGVFEEFVLDEEIGLLWIFGMMLCFFVRVDFFCRIGFMYC